MLLLPNIMPCPAYEMREGDVLAEIIFRPRHHPASPPTRWGSESVLRWSATQIGCKGASSFTSARLIVIYNLEARPAVYRVSILECSSVHNGDV